MAELPAALTAALSDLAEGLDGPGLLRDARAISEAYRTRTGLGERLLTREGEAAAYALSRMPATFAAIRAALFEALRASDLQPHTLLDCGAGTGAASWAADALLALQSATCVEREAAMRAVGERLMRAGSEALARAEWHSGDVRSGEALPGAALVIEGYMLGELAPEDRPRAALRLWEAAQEMLLLVEPGTPQGFAALCQARALLLEHGAQVAAPCPKGAVSCPMVGEDWCHFAVRVPRSRLHKRLKGGDAPYEDEKFAYLALTRIPAANACAARVLRHPQIAPGRVTLALCEAGTRREIAVTKKDPLFKRARKASAGDAL